MYAIAAALSANSSTDTTTRLLAPAKVQDRGALVTWVTSFHDKWTRPRNVNCETPASVTRVETLRTFSKIKIVAPKAE